MMATLLNTLLVVIMGMVIVVISDATPTLMRHKRDLLQFGDMIDCVTPRTQGYLRSALDYIGYGCYCGFGGSGTPVDGTDGCCKVHDNCYYEVEDSGVCGFENQIYLADYVYATAKCGTSSADIACQKAADYGPREHLWPECAAALCECDKSAVQCFAANAETYSDAYKRYDSQMCA